jgi:hypothetical protein
MSSVDRVTLLTLCAAFLSGAIMSYRGMNGVSDTLVFSGLVVALLAVGFGAVWIVIGQNPLAIFWLNGRLALPDHVSGIGRLIGADR